jgi:hypothetical protein
LLCIQNHRNRYIRINYPLSAKACKAARTLETSATENSPPPGLSKDETEKYVRHHLKAAGCSRDLFTQEAFTVIFESSQGIPRKINNLRDACLLDAFICRRSPLDDHLVKRVTAPEFAPV